jgi:hypothetical protein
MSEVVGLERRGFDVTDFIIDNHHCILSGGVGSTNQEPDLESVSLRKVSKQKLKYSSNRTHGTPPEPRIYEEEWKSCYQRLPLIWAMNPQ